VGEIRQKAGVRSQAIGHNYRKIGKGDGGKSENRNPDFLTADYTDLADDRTFLNFPIFYVSRFSVSPLSAPSCKTVLDGGLTVRSFDLQAPDLTGGAPLVSGGMKLT